MIFAVKFQMLEFYKLNEKNRTTDICLEDHSESIRNLANIIACLVENERIQQALEFQDEVDRNTVALMGYKEPQSSNSSIHAGGAHIFHNSSVLTQASIASPNASRSAVHTSLHSPKAPTNEGTAIKVPGAESEGYIASASGVRRNHSLGLFPVLSGQKSCGSPRVRERMKSSGGGFGSASGSISLDKQCLTCSGQASVVL